MLQFIDVFFVVVAGHDGAGNPTIVVGVHIYLGCNEVYCLLTDDSWASCAAWDGSECDLVDWDWVRERIDARGASWFGLGSGHIVLDQGGLHGWCDGGSSASDGGDSTRCVVARLSLMCALTEAQNTFLCWII